MNQFIAWTALANEGLGCNLQHFHPTISSYVAETYSTPESWSLRGQLVFGKPIGPPRGGVDKAFAPLEERVKVYGSKTAAK
jgi:predicted oxidoreductase (fatty acid repression mutant protein)